MADDFIAGAGMLTPAERNILQFYVDGYEIAEIPELACVSIIGAQAQQSIYKKLGVGSRGGDDAIYRAPSPWKPAGGTEQHKK